MKERRIILKAPHGLHARPASELVRIAAAFKSTIEVESVLQKRRVNAKSILSMLTLGAAYGTELIVRATGPDEEEALNAVAGFLMNLKE